MTVLDTQAWLWWLHDPERLSIKARRHIESDEKGALIRVSVISVWEVATKFSLGKLSLPIGIDEWFKLASSYPGISIEPLLAQDALASTTLPGEFHKDPADRIIVALSRRLNADLITSDRLIQLYPYVNSIW
jgi:PIN domain nuclease of toxin-antitoxin system